MKFVKTTALALAIALTSACSTEVKEQEPANPVKPPVTVQSLQEQLDGVKAVECPAGDAECEGFKQMAIKILQEEIDKRGAQ